MAVRYGRIGRIVLLTSPFLLKLHIDFRWPPSPSAPRGSSRYVLTCRLARAIPLPVPFAITVGRTRRGVNIDGPAGQRFALQFTGPLHPLLNHDSVSSVGQQCPSAVGIILLGRADSMMSTMSFADDRIVAQSVSRNTYSILFTDILVSGSFQVVLPNTAVVFVAITLSSESCQCT